MEEKKRVCINGVSIYKILGYFIVYSVLGFVLETIFALIVYGRFESRQGVLYGPFCPIYGVGAIALIIALQKFQKNEYTLFFGGIVVGSIVEFIISLIAELIFNVRWWDYSDRFLNINGRICLLYSIYWGIISVFLMKELNPKVDKLIEWLKKKIKMNILKILTILTTVFLFIDLIVSGIAIEFFISKTVVENDINVKNKDMYTKTYEKVYNNKYIETVVNNIWNEKFMIKIYPNLQINLDNGKKEMVRDYYKEIQPYYYKFNIKDIE